MIRLISFLILLNITNVSCQNSTNDRNISDFEVFFKDLKKTLIVDDITVKHSNNPAIDYNVLKKYIKDSSGKLLITVDNKKHHFFEAIGVKKINDSISCYLFSHKVNANDYYYAYLAVFNKNNLTDFRGIYSNSEEKFGCAFIDNKYALFKTDERAFYDYYVVDNQGFIFEDEEKLDFENISFSREISYSINFNAKFFREKKVLLRINGIDGKKPRQVLRNIGEEKLTLKQAYFIDNYAEDEFMEFIYLNILSSKDSTDYKTVYEVIKDKYIDDEWLENIPLSEYFKMPSNKEIVKKHTLER